MDKKQDRFDFNDFQKKLNQQFEEKVDLIEVQAALNESQSDVGNSFFSLKTH